MRLRLHLLSVGIVLVCSYLFSNPATADTQGGYSHDSGRKTTNPDWMSSLRDDELAARLTLPGTHDTMALYGVDSVKTQTLSLDDQLQSGIRALDIRCVISGDHLVIHHGAFYQNANLDDVLTKVTNFLKNHPREAIYMRIKKENASNDDAQFEKIFRDVYYTNSTYNPYFWVPSGMVFWAPEADVRLRDIRGKIVILQDFVTKTTPGTLYGIDWGRLSIQDNWELSTNWALYDKWTAVRNHLGSAGANYGNTIYANFLSGNGGSLPYFVASGKSSPGTGDPLLWTGLTTPFGTNKDTYPDFPRRDCFFNACSIYFLGTNELTKNWLNANRGSATNRTRVGLIFSDFPGPDLITSTINFNIR